jgi:hypothetical protein
MFLANINDIVIVLKGKYFHPARFVGIDPVTKQIGIKYDSRKQIFFVVEKNIYKEPHRNVKPVDYTDDRVDAADLVLPPGWFFVEAIRGRRIKNGRVEYLVKWKDCNESENTWQRTKFLSQDKLVRREIKEWLKHHRSTSTNVATAITTSTAPVQSKRDTPNNPTTTTTVVTPLKKEETLDDDTNFDSSDDEQVEERFNSRNLSLK